MSYKNLGTGWAVRVTVAGLTACLCGRAQAHSYMVDYVPNGAKTDCKTCHNGSSGGSRNPFGQDVEAITGGASHVEFWSPSLAALDSDGDGATNGRELQDPQGLWQLGDPDPGISALVTKPGDDTSFPPTPTPTPTPQETASPTPTPTPEPVPAGEIRDFLLGIIASPDRKDLNADSAIDVADLLFAFLR